MSGRPTTIYNNLGLVHHHLGDLEKAKEYYERALAISLGKLRAFSWVTRRRQNSILNVPLSFVCKSSALDIVMY